MRARQPSDDAIYYEYTSVKPTQNAFIDRFNRTYLSEILDFYLFRKLIEVLEITERWLNKYKN